MFFYEWRVPETESTETAEGEWAAEAGRTRAESEPEAWESSWSERGGEGDVAGWRGGAGASGSSRMTA